MPMRLNDPELKAKAEAMKLAGYRYSDQYDARIRWLELELARFEIYVGALEARLLTKIDGRPRPPLPDPELDEED
jgi:hypothetical protein